VTSITEALTQHKILGTYRSLTKLKNHTDFSSNDYLGLANNSEIRFALIKELQAGCPLGATGSRLVSGETDSHERVEQFLAQTFHAPSALLFSSGFMANLGVLSALGDLEAEFFSDELNHASLIDGIRSTKSARSIFRHNDMNDLKRLLALSTTKLKVVVTESVFSMDGDLAPISELLELARHYDACLVLDEAHATGIFGSRGLGRLEDLDSSGVHLIQIHTGGKALGGQGAFVLSSTNFRNLLINRARPFIYSTALAPLSALQIEFAIKAILEAPLQGQRLLQISENFRMQLAKIGFVSSSRSQIVPLILGSNEKVLRCQSALQAQQIDVRAIRSPTVPIGTERLRITLKSFHVEKEREDLLAALKESFKQ
jgi:8-amino-7-oxononanoate synthase